MDDDVVTFRNDAMVEFFSFISSYAHSLGLQNAICLMPTEIVGMNDPRTESGEANIQLSRICDIEFIDNVGTDPYWLGSTEPPYNPYERIYNLAKNCVEVSNNYSKDNHLWIQGFGCPSGREEEIIVATEAAYDSGARTILSWGFHGCESNTYRSHNPARAWNATVEGMKRIKSFERDRILAENRRKFMK